MLQSIDRHRPPTLPHRLCLGAHGLGDCRGTLAPPREAIEQAVIQVFGVAHDELHRISRGRAKVALARQVAMYLAHVACRLSLTDAGKLFNRDRTTVAHACAVIEDRRDDPLFDRALDLLEWAVAALTARSAGTRLLSS
jgi:hypothetical protein